MNKIKCFFSAINNYFYRLGRCLKKGWIDFKSGIKENILNLLLAFNWIMILISCPLLLCCVIKIINQDVILWLYILFNSIVMVVILNHLIDTKENKKE